MYYKIPDLLEFITKYVTLNPGDMILTGFTINFKK